MLTVKAFEKGLVCRGFTYEVGKEYSIPTKEVKMYEKGFHASANCDISETLDTYQNVGNVEYALVDLHVIEVSGNEAVGDRIKIIKKLESLEELIEYDKTGEWCFFYAEYLCNIGSKDDLIKKLEDAVIKKDTTGKWCYYFADFIQGADINKLQDAVIEKDQTGEWCYHFANFIQGADITRLENVTIEKDTTGKWCYHFAKDVQGADISKLQDAVIQRDQTGEWCHRFAQVSKQKERSVIEKLRNLEEENKYLKEIMRDVLDSKAYVEYVDECRRWGHECSFCGAFVRNDQPLSEMKHKQDCVITKMIKILEGGKNYE